MRRRSLIIGAVAVGAMAAPVFAQTTAPASASPPPPTEIEPRNALEHAFVRALHDEAERPAFRRLLLTSYVALAIAERSPDAPPRMIELRPGLRASLLFTSGARTTEIIGPQAPVLMLTGRRALERVRGGNVIININLAPALVLEAEDVDAILAMPDESPAPPTGSIEPLAPRLAGPTQ